MKKYFRIVIKGTVPQVFFDFEVPDNASLPQFWNNVLGVGYFITEKFVVTADQIAMIHVVTIEAQQSGFTPRVVN